MKIKSALALAAILFVCLWAQAQEVKVDELLARAEAAVEDAKSQNTDLLAPKTFSEATAALNDAKSLQSHKKSDKAVADKLQLCLTKIQAARDKALAAQTTLGDALSARKAAAAVGADSARSDSWKKGESLFNDAALTLERGKKLDPKTVDVIIGSYRAARLDILRSQVLGAANTEIAELRKAGGASVTPTLVLRAEQAVSRAEAALAQGKPDVARAEAGVAIQNAKHARAMMANLQAIKKKDSGAESVLLDYDDMLESVADHLNGDLDFSKGTDALGDQLIALIDTAQDSLATQLANLRSNITETRSNYEQSVSEAQTNLADAQHRISELEKRLSTLEGQRDAARESAQKKSVRDDRISRAQLLFKPGEAVIVQDSANHVVIRLTGLSFPSGITTVNKSQYKLLDKVTDAVALFPGAAISVEGHTDANGEAKMLQKLSEGRAKSVADYLTKAMKLKPDAISSEGFGGTRPILPGDTPENRSRNRRVEVVLAVP